ncbi:MAG: HEPN domain-containing protein [Candidatus Entotheonellia bacterium]
MELARAESSLKAAKACLEQRWWDSAASRAYFAMFQAAVCALEAYGIRRTEWSHRALHAALADVLIRRRKVFPAVLAGALPSAMEIRHTADYRQPAPSERQVRRVVLTAEQFMAAIQEVLHHGQGSSV